MRENEEGSPPSQRQVTEEDLVRKGQPKNVNVQLPGNRKLKFPSEARISKVTMQKNAEITLELNTISGNNN